MAGNLSPARRIVVLVTHLMLQSRIVQAARALGYDVTVTASAEEARRALRSGPPELLVLDLQADGLAWQEVVAAARQAPAGPVPVLAFGQHTRPALLRAARAAGCDLVVPRSRLAKELPRLIQRARQRSGG